VVRTRSCRAMENRLAAAARLDTATFGTHVSDEIMDLSKGKAAYRPATILTYGGIGVVLVGLVILCLINALKAGAPWLLIAFMALVYVALSVVWARVWRETLRS
jgi:F0F1-type ATP synthase assembly protein I